MMSSYTYDALDESKREIRLLHLIPGNVGEPIKCNITCCSLDAKPSYQALSYVWGDPTPTACIMIQEEKLPVAANLHMALQYLRSASKTRILWIDAVCINQANKLERESQVLLMNAIYSDTEQVLCWLGSAEDELGIRNASGEPLSIDEALKSLGCESGHRDRPCLLNGCSHYNNLESRALALCTRSGSTSSSELQEIFAALDLIDFLGCGYEKPHLDVIISETADDTGTRAIHDRLKGAINFLNNLFANRWWGRVWTFQELVLPQDVLFIHYHLTIPWSTIYKAWESLNLHTRHCCSDKFLKLEEVGQQCFEEWVTKIGTVSRYRPGDDRWYLDRQTMLELLVGSSAREATDARDHIYGVLGLVKTHTIRPDYSAKISQVYIEAAKSMLQCSDSLYPLLCRPLGARCQDLPSWVYDWSLRVVPASTQGFVSLDKWLYYAGGRLNSNPRFCCDTFLRLEGLGVDTISAMGDLCSSPSHEETARILKEWERIAGKGSKGWDQPYPNGQTRSDAFRHTLSGDTVKPSKRLTRGLGAPPPMFIRSGNARGKDKALCLEWWNLVDEPEEDRPSAELITKAWDWIWHFQNVVGPFVRALRFFVTSRGLMGLGPAHMKPGDRVFVLKGGAEPFVLRQKHIDGHGDCSHAPDMSFEIVGRCYVHGIMDGQVLGPEEVARDSQRNMTWDEEVGYRKEEVFLV